MNGLDKAKVGSLMAICIISLCSLVFISVILGHRLADCESKCENMFGREVPCETKK